MSTDYKAAAAEADAKLLELFRGNPGTMKAFRQVVDAASGDGALDTKTKELMTVAIAIATHCQGCIVYHVRAAHKKGATREEILDTIGVAVEMGGGPATVYGAEALAAYDQFAG